MSRRWAGRLAVFVALVALLHLGLRVLGYGPRLLPLVLLGAVVFAVVLVVADALTDLSTEWSVVPVPRSREVRGDARLSSYLRIVESHLTSETVDPVLRDRLAGLADRRLRQRYGVRRPSPEADRLLGPELAAVLDGPPRRLCVTEIDRVLQRIEKL